MNAIADLLSLFLACSLGGCAPAGPLPAADLAARYSAAIHGAVLDEPFRLDVALSLYDDDRYRLRIDVWTRDEEETELATGTYRLAGRRLILRGEDGARQTFFVRGDRLVLDTDWKFTLARRILGIPEIDLHAEGPPLALAP